jgi:hypothetical protein
MTAGPSPGAAFDVGAWLSVLGIEQYETEGVTVTRRQGASLYLMRMCRDQAQLMAKTGNLIGARDLLASIIVAVGEHRDGAEFKESSTGAGEQPECLVLTNLRLCATTAFRLCRVADVPLSFLAPGDRNVSSRSGRLMRDELTHDNSHGRLRRIIW